ncbi:YceI-like domain protein [Sphingobacterium spiritivorum ATCC 33300]|uniref:YceI-like domain protein n=2 Tax=Sphingobacterium spiritivorum TaxID=258 RepID=C2FTP2_SPHSI|nr:YceI family protein [Sphingobacterium spiritivorum]EEI93707.1 YceI-like domain protein [Sphingobacterium spiritivorum ATCC 33300]QQS95965.1 polyisoprenoid-binding protein [Sphingobacterium spiritivorum]
MATIWNLDSAHSELEFKVKHMMISNVKGLFQDFEIQLEGNGEDLTSATIKAAIKTDSINTKNEQRDQHLKSGDFFDAANYPEIKFVSTSIVKKSEDEFAVTGDLTIKDVTKPITLDVDFGGIAIDPWGNSKAGYTFSGKINRSDFGLTWNAALETGGVMVSEEVKISGDIQFSKS